jgi:hypothetical protein
MAPLPIVLMLLLVQSSFELSSGTALYAWVIYGNGVPDSIQNDIDVDSDKLLQKLQKHEGHGFSALAPGHLVGGGGARDLLSDGDARRVQEPPQSGASDGPDDGRRGLVGTCPSSCSNSGSTYCRSLGCAYCSTCRRRRRNIRYLRNLASPQSVENALDKDLAAYCKGVPDCALWSKVFVVSEADGSLSPAT